MKTLLMVAVVSALVMISAAAYAPLVNVVSDTSSSDTSVVDLSDKTSDVCYSPSLDNE